MSLYPLDRSVPNAKKVWTKEEEEYLSEKWGTTSLKSIAKRLGRSENAVIVRIQRLGLGPGLQNGVRISWNTFVKTLLGGSNSGGYFRKRLEAAGFPTHSQIVRGRNGARFTTVDIEEFWEFAEKHKDLFDFSRLEPLAFGPEPEWATRKRKLDAERLRTGHAHNDPWTCSEDRRLEMLISQHKYTYKELSKKLRRSEGAIKRRIYDIGLTEKPVRGKTRPWTEAETQKLVQMRADGYGWDNIAEELGRSALAIRGKYERILNPDYTKRIYRNAREGRERHERQSTCRHYIKVDGCEYGRDTCRYCRKYEELAEGEKQRSSYIGIRGLSPEEIMERQEEK